VTLGAADTLRCTLNAKMIAETCELSGYANSLYARSFAALGEPVELPRSGGWLITRSINGTCYRDAMGPYPLFMCQDWSAVGSDLQELANALVSVAIVADPFGAHDLETLTATFTDVVRPFKQHYVVDLERDFPSFVHRHHVRNSRRALDEVEVRVLDCPTAHLDDWVALYGVLIDRHAIRGLRRFTREAFDAQLRVPGLVALQAHHKGILAGMLLWYLVGNVAYYHLGAFSPLGYELGASYALFWRAIEYFKSTATRWLDLGGGAGAVEADSGLSRFKAGWSTGTRVAYFLGRVLDRTAYARLTSAVPPEKNVASFFPAYRIGEYGPTF
jgi:Acetyltransferase (GNAT) domain